MKKFSFRLQKLLDIRQKKEDEQKVRLAKAIGDYQLEVKKKEKMLNNIKEYRKKLKTESNEITIDDLKYLDKLTINTYNALKKQDIIINEKKQKMDEQIDIYNKLKKEKKVVEKLKEIAIKKYNEESNKEEQLINDEIGKDRFIKSKGNINNTEINNIE